MNHHLRDVLQHCLNPLHLYCRLRELGLPSALARCFCAGYERAVYRPIAG